MARAFEDDDGSWLPPPVAAAPHLPLVPSEPPSTLFGDVFECVCEKPRLGRRIFEVRATFSYFGSKKKTLRPKKQAESRLLGTFLVRKEAEAHSFRMQKAFFALINIAAEIFGRISHGAKDEFEGETAAAKALDPQCLYKHDDSGEIARAVMKKHGVKGEAVALLELVYAWFFKEGGTMAKSLDEYQSIDSIKARLQKIRVAQHLNVCEESFFAVDVVETHERVLEGPEEDSDEEVDEVEDEAEDETKKPDGGERSLKRKRGGDGEE